MIAGVSTVVILAIIITLIVVFVVNKSEAGDDTRTKNYGAYSKVKHEGAATELPVTAKDLAID